MEIKKEEWLGRWDNFENYIDDPDPYLVRTWEEAEEKAKGNRMFPGGVKAFWKMACTTITPENPQRLSGWEISDAPEGLRIRWLGAAGETLWEGVYRQREVVEKGLEGKTTLLFAADEESPFCCLLSMEPMPERKARLEGGYLSHLHFQFASKREDLLSEEGGLKNPRWYATMCAGEGTLLERCNIVRGLHRLAPWKELPKEP